MIWKRTSAVTSSPGSCRLFVYHTKMRKSRQVPFSSAQQANLPVCSPLAGLFSSLQPWMSDREAVNTNVNVIDFTRLGIKPEFTRPKVNALTSRSSEPKRRLLPNTAPHCRQIIQKKQHNTTNKSKKYLFASISVGLFSIFNVKTPSYLRYKAVAESTLPDTESRVDKGTESVTS